jgi:starvation-inducible DNA-binding protein
MKGSAPEKTLRRGQKETTMATAEKIESKNEKASVKNIGQLDHAAVEEISNELRSLLADSFALYLKTKNFHWHMTGKNFRDYHLLLDEQGDQIFAMTDPIAERARKLGGTTIHSIGEIATHQRLKDNNAQHVSPKAMLSELFADNRQLTAFLRSAHEVCERHGDVATTSLIEVWIDETERRSWFLGEIVDSLD